MDVILFVFWAWLAGVGLGLALIALWAAVHPAGHTSSVYDHTILGDRELFREEEGPFRDEKR